MTFDFISFDDAGEVSFYSIGKIGREILLFSTNFIENHSFSLLFDPSVFSTRTILLIYRILIRVNSDNKYRSRTKAL